jgi:hypothetical protein
MSETCPFSTDRLQTYASRFTQIKRSCSIAFVSAQ